MNGSAMLIAVVAALVAIAHADKCAAVANKMNYSLAGLATATYGGTLVGVSGSAPVTVHMGWCTPSVKPVECNRTASNATQTMAITSNTSTLSACVASFGVFVGGMTVAPGGAALMFKLWSASGGVMADVTVACDAAGGNGTATLVSAVNAPIYSYALTFKSKEACGVPQA
jgi:hypothetical protein